MKDSLLRFIANHASIFDMGSAADKLEVVLTTRRERLPGQQRLHWFVFQSGSPQPLLVACHYASPNYNVDLVAEYEVLHQLWVSASPSVAPEPLALTELHGYSVLVERYFDGQSLTHELRQLISSRAYDEAALLALVRDHMNSVQALRVSLDATAQPVAADRLETALVSLYRRNAIDEWADRTLAARCAASLRHLIEVVCRETVMTRVVHYDFTPPHILRSASDTRLIDWEGCDVSALRLLEPPTFVYSYLAELSYLGVLSLTSDYIASFEAYLRGDLEVGSQFDAFLAHGSIPAQDATSHRAVWFAYVLSLGAGWMDTIAPRSLFLPALERLLRIVTNPV